MKDNLNLLAWDVGNSAVRTILCRFRDGKVTGEEVLVEPNGSFEENGYIYWDMDEIFASMKRGLAKAAEVCTRIDSAGICTWGVDFRLLDENGRFVSKALCYRNRIGEEETDALSGREQEEMFFRTGILCDKINSVYMLKGMHRHMPEVLRAGKKLLMVPDVFVYLFTGVLMNEPSELSTTQMLDVKTMRISREMCDYAGVPEDLFSVIGEHGKAVGNILPEILSEAGISYDIPLICVPSHDTASAVMGIPSPLCNYLFVSSGTWALIGALVDRPVVTEEVMRARLTNEAGPFGKTTLLRNSAGMFILQRLKAEYQEETGKKISWDDFTAVGAACGKDPFIYDVNDSRLFNPAAMKREITDIFIENGVEECGWPEILSSTYASLGESFAENLRAVMKCTGMDFNSVYIVGGGSRNTLINQRCADSLKLPVAACDMECSSIGNAVVQIAYFHPEYGFEALKEIVYRSLRVTETKPGCGAGN